MNKVKFEIKAKSRLSLNQKSFIAIVIGVLLGVLALMLPETVRSNINEKIVSPIFYMFIGIVSTISAFMIFFKVSQSIYVIGDKNLFIKN